MSAYQGDGARGGLPHVGEFVGKVAQQPHVSTLLTGTSVVLAVPALRGVVAAVNQAARTVVDVQLRRQQLAKETKADEASVEVW